MIEGFTHHGGGLAHAVARFGGDPADWLDLSTGINPCPWPAAAKIDWHPLPDAGALAALEAAAARHFGVEAADCCAVPGSEMALRMIGRLIGGRAAYLWPAYRTHGTAFADAVPVQGVPRDRTILLLANPNNPDGRIIAPATLQAWHEELAARGGWLVVDEAFADATPDVSVAGHAGHPGQAGQWGRLVVLRSFGKFFGLAGLRLGFVLGPPALLGGLRALLGDWPLGTAALGLGAAAYQDQAWIAQARRDLAERAARMDQLLLRHGWRGQGACPHFRLLEDDRAGLLFSALARHRILGRPFGYDPRWLRLGVPAARPDRARLERALADV